MSARCMRGTNRELEGPLFCGKFLSSVAAVQGNSPLIWRGDCVKSGRGVSRLACSSQQEQACGRRASLGLCFSLDFRIDMQNGCLQNRCAELMSWFLLVYGGVNEEA